MLLKYLLLFWSLFKIICEISDSDYKSNNQNSIETLNINDEYGYLNECLNNNLIDKEITNTLNKIRDLFFREPNPFVKENVKNILTLFVKQNFQIPKDKHLSIELNYEILSLLKTFKQLNSICYYSLGDQIENLILILNNINLKEIELWNEAEIFLKLPSIMRLKQNDSIKLIKIIKDSKLSRDLERFLNDKYEEENIKKGLLESEVKNLKQKGLNLITLISQIYKKKPKEKHLFEIIKMNLDNLNFFINKSIYISSLDSSTIYFGIIKKCFQDHDGKIKITSENYNRKEADIIVNIDNQKIIDATIIQKTEKLLYEKIYQFYPNFKTDEVILKNVLIVKNSDYLYEKTNFLDDGQYNVIMGNRFIISEGHYLIFENINNGKTEILEVYDGGIKNNKINIKDASVFHKNWPSKSFFDQFLKYFKILSEEKIVVSFNSENEVNRYFQIKDDNNLGNESSELVKKMEIIYEIQTNLIMLLNKGNNEYLIDFLIESYSHSSNNLFNKKALFEKIEKRENGKVILEGINKILEIKNSLGEKSNEFNILTELVKEYNYCRLINKEQGIKTQRIMELITKGKQITDQLKGKTIIAFYGNTGSGKSTTVNYFAGVPLKKEKNNFGDDIIKIDEEEYKGITAKIGHSLGTSETIYAQAFKIIDDTYCENKFPKEKVKDIFLCDNPGYKDTRGIEYEMITNLSIDESIKNCGKLQAAVLVLPFTVFTHDRANLLIEAILNFEERFPDLLDISSSTFKSVFIVITKYDSENQIEGFDGRLNMHIQEESRNIGELSKSDKYSNKYEILNAKKRLDIFNSLYEMKKNEQILFINVVDNLDREDFFSKIYNSRGIDKNKYKKSMLGSEIIKKFSEEVNKITHTWHRIILDKYLKEIPKDLEFKKKEIKRISDGIANKKSVIEDISKSIEKSEKQIEIFNSYLQSYNEYSENYQNLDFNEIDIESKKSELISLKKNLENTILKLNDNQKNYNTTFNEISLLENKLKEYRSKLDIYKIGETEIMILNDSYNYGEEFYYTVGKNDEFEKALKEVRPIKFDNNVKMEKFKVGYSEESFISSVFIEKKFALVPENTNFDQAGMLKKYQNNAIYKANIKSNLCKLTRINSTMDGKKMVIQFSSYFKIGKNIPYLKISHMIPNESINKDNIINLESEINLLQSKISTLMKYKNDLEKDNNILANDIRYLNNLKINIKKLIKTIHAVQNEKLKIEQIQEEIQVLENRINNDIEQRFQKETELNVDVARLPEEKENLKLKEKEHKKLALIILDQLEKNVPQSLLDYIDIAYDIENNMNSSNTQTISNDPKTMIEAKNEQKKNFKAFRTEFSKYLHTLKEKVLTHLKNSTFTY